MRILVVADGHYFEDNNCDVYVDSVFDYSFFKRYIDCFGKIEVLCRIKKASDNICKKLKKSSGDGISFLKVPDFHGPIEFVINYRKISKAIKKMISVFDVAIFRIPGALPNLILKEYSKLSKPYALEVVVDPWLFFSPGTSKSLLRPIIRVNWTNLTKKYCKKARCVSYVTQKYLQLHYPPSKSAFVASYSSVEISDDSIKNPRFYKKKNKIVISHVCNGFNTYGKGHIQLMKAVSLLKKQGINIEIIFVGDGPLRPVFEKFACKNNIKNETRFVGSFSNGDEVRKVIQNSDIFVFPSKAEGLPRVLIEAMAEGLPCLSTNVCGIPEVLGEEYLVKYGDYIALSKKIKWLIDNPSEMNEASIKNVKMVRNFSKSILSQKRLEFYNCVKDAGIDYMKKNGGSDE